VEEKRRVLEETLMEGVEPGADSAMVRAISAELPDLNLLHLDALRAVMQ
jgi:hypothetical protein